MDFKILLILSLSYVDAAEKTVPVCCRDIRVDRGFRFLVGDHFVLDKGNLYSEEWTEEGTMKAYIDYDPPNNSSDSPIIELSTGRIITAACKSVNYTATLNEGSQRSEIWLYFKVLQCEDDPEDTDVSSWIIALGCMAIFIFIPGLLAYVWWRKKRRSSSRATEVSIEEARSLSTEPRP